MRMFAFALTAAALGAAAPLVAQDQAYPPPAPAPVPDMIAMHCGAGMGEMMRGATFMRFRAPATRSDTVLRDVIRSMMPMMMVMMGPPSPGMILDHKDQLKLTTDQVNKLTTLQRQAEAVCREHIRLAMDAHQAANALLEADMPDWNAFTAKLKDASGHMVEAHVAMAKAAVAARQDLNPGQRQTLKDLVQQMQRKP